MSTSSRRDHKRLDALGVSRVGADGVPLSLSERKSLAVDALETEVRMHGITQRFAAAALDRLAAPVAVATVDVDGRVTSTRRLSVIDRCIHAGIRTRLIPLED